MRIGIIGAGFTGLSAGYHLAKLGHKVFVFEKEEKPGGLAIGFKEQNWKWPLEKHYHHWFFSDWDVRNLAKEINHKVSFTRPKSSIYINGEILQLDSPLSLMMFSKLPFIERIRTGVVLSYLKYTNNWKKLESQTAETFLKRTMGEASWNILWRPLFEKKFSKYAGEIPASWFWARIKKRSAQLGYPEGGFESFASAIEKKIKKYGGEFRYKTVVEKIVKSNKKLQVSINSEIYEFDKLICTLPTPLFMKITKGLPEEYKRNLLSLNGIGALNLILSLNKQFLRDGSYWLSINARHFPFLAIVEHTNFIDKKYYSGEHIVYIGNYLPHDHEYFKMDAVDLIREFYPYLKTINPKFDKSWINKAYLFKAPFAQPIIPLNYSKILPSLKTPIDGLYIANIQQVYPWDRGTNYAVELGVKVAEMVIKSQ